MAKATKKSESKETNGANGGKAGSAEQQAAQPMLNVLAQYVKDLSFENPNAPTSLRPRETSPEININVNVNSRGLSEDSYEVELVLEAKATANNEVVFNIELTYAGIFRLQGVPQEALQPALLIECPRLLFPFARQIVSDCSRNGGFPPLMIDPIDFARLFQSRIAQQQAGAQPAS